MFDIPIAVSFGTNASGYGGGNNDRAGGKNALNLVSLGTPWLSVDGSAFGVIRTARDMGVIQLGLRLQF